MRQPRDATLFYQQRADVTNNVVCGVQTVSMHPAENGHENLSLCSFAKNVSNSLLRKGCSRAGVFIRDHSEFGYVLMKQQAFIHYLTWTYLTLCASSLPWAVIPVDLFGNCVYDYFE